MCNLPRSREDRIAIHSDHSHTQRRPHCHSYRSASPTSEQHLHLEPSPSSRPLGFNHHTPWLTSAEPALAMIRRSHPWFAPQTLQIRIWFHRQRAPHVLKHGSSLLSLRRTALCEPCILLCFRKTQRTTVQHEKEADESEQCTTERVQKASYM